MATDLHRYHKIILISSRPIDEIIIPTWLISASLRKYRFGEALRLCVKNSPDRQFLCTGGSSTEQQRFLYVYKKANCSLLTKS
jgi:hypothetical protein